MNTILAQRKNVVLRDMYGFDEWRRVARFCLATGLRPYNVMWCDKSFLNGEELKIHETYDCTASQKVPKIFIDQAREAILYKDGTSCVHLYRVLWRLVHEDAHLINDTTDPDISELSRRTASVRRGETKEDFFKFLRNLREDDRFT